jgi:ABC-2 type transport system permease protein
MKKVWFIALKEIRDFFQDKGDLIFSLVLPIVIFGLMYGAFGNQLQFNGTAYIVNQDEGGIYSDQLIDQLGTYKGLTIKNLTVADADSRLERSNIQMAIFIPAEFSANLAAGNQSQIVFKQRGNGSTEGQIAASLVRGAAEKINQQVQLQRLVAADLSGSGAGAQQIESALQIVSAQEAAKPAVQVVEETFGVKPDAVKQYLPGIMTMFVLFAVNLTAQALVDERRRGTLERLLATRLTVGELFTGKFVAYTFRGFVQTIILMLLAYIVFGLFTPLTFLEASFLALIYSAACSTLGIIIGSIARSQNQATWIAVFFTMLMVMLSGTFMAITPGTTLAAFSKISLNTYANDAFRSIIIDKASLGSVTTEILVLVGVAVVGLVISRLLFKVGQGSK